MNFVRQSQGSNQYLSHTVLELLTAHVGICGGEDTKGTHSDGSDCEALCGAKRRLRGDMAKWQNIEGQLDGRQPAHEMGCVMGWN